MEKLKRGSTAAKAAQSPAPGQQSSDSAKTEERKSVPLHTTEFTAAAMDSATPATTTAPEGAKLSATADNAAAKPVKPENMDVENELLDRFREFSASERLKVQDRQRHLARHDMNVVVNDLKNFANEFSYSTPIPYKPLHQTIGESDSAAEIRDKRREVFEPHEPADIAVPGLNPALAASLDLTTVRIKVGRYGSESLVLKDHLCKSQRFRVDLTSKDEIGPELTDELKVVDFGTFSTFVKWASEGQSFWDNGVFDTGLPCYQFARQFDVPQFRLDSLVAIHKYYPDSTPDLDFIRYAFKELPSASPLCRYLTYAYIGLYNPCSARGQEDLDDLEYWISGIPRVFFEKVFISREAFLQSRRWKKDVGGVSLDHCYLPWKQAVDVADARDVRAMMAKYEAQGDSWERLS
ncbi:hypothetical protein K490DRAFT_61676 [Saccharata proteae CBS 121410]|uniref:Uncharacterized protein n=1 Tax=Saccharata proteae CBS 121410 TaxID=1314787 RepID=A0A9P4I5M0_9PEZI|nr:hypothetical protein K490DRAFT_61676 [Saccharata proteae CBS 121410]